MSFARDIVKRHKSARRKTAANNKHISHTTLCGSSSSISSTSNSPINMYSNKFRIKRIRHNHHWIHFPSSCLFHVVESCARLCTWTLVLRVCVCVCLPASQPACISAYAPSDRSLSYLLTIWIIALFTLDMFVYWDFHHVPFQLLYFSAVCIIVPFLWRFLYAYRRAHIHYMQTTLVTEQMNGNTAIRNIYNIWTHWTNEKKNERTKACEYTEKDILYEQKSEINKNMQSFTHRSCWKSKSLQCVFIVNNVMVFSFLCFFVVKIKKMNFHILHHK